MDTIRFELKHPDEVAILINGCDLIDRLREVELPFAIREGHPSIAGSYQGLSSHELFEDAEVLLGKVHPPGSKTTLLGCTCGFPDCWPSYVKITVEKDHIIWNDFEQPHRGASKGADQWSYEALGPFVFDRAQYMGEVERMVSRSRQERANREP